MEPDADAPSPTPPPATSVTTSATTPPALERLLEAHVAHEVATLTGEGFAELARAEVEHALGVAGDLPLERVVPRAAVAAVADKYVASFRLPGAIPSVAGDVARRVRRVLPADATLGDVVDRASVAEVVAVLAEMRTARERLLRGVATSASLQAGVADAVHGAARGAWVRARRTAERVPGAGLGLRVSARLGTAVTDRVAPGLASGLGAGIDQRGREAAEVAAGLALALLGSGAADAIGDEEVVALALELWDDLAARPLGEVVDAVSEEHLDALVAAVYGVWLDLRTSEELRALVAAGVEWFFDTYGATPLAALLEEFGLGVDDLVEEAVRFGPPALAALADAGVLTVLVRRRLEGFYRSPAATDALEGPPGQ